MITTSEPTAIGIFDDLEKAERTIDELRRARYRSEEIGIIGHVGEDQAVPPPHQVHRRESNAVDGFVRGNIVGAITGGVFGLLLPAGRDCRRRLIEFLRGPFSAP